MTRRQECPIWNQDAIGAFTGAAWFGIAGKIARDIMAFSFGFGWFGRLNLLNDVAARGAGKSFRRLVGRVVLGQGECPVLNLEDGEDHCADAIRWWRTISDGSV